MHKETKCLYFRYAYDAGNRLVEVAYPGRNGITDTEYLRYDKAGNRTERIRGAVHEQYLYDECNRLLQITDGIRQVKNYTYDNSGNMLSDGEMSYLYDGFGRLEPKKEWLSLLSFGRAEQYCLHHGKQRGDRKPVRVRCVWRAQKQHGRVPQQNPLHGTAV